MTDARKGAALATPTPEEREAARLAAAALRAVFAGADKGEAATMHADFARPRRGVWITTWAGLPGFSLQRCSREGTSYQHSCLPGWSYQRHEIKTEMIPDLEALAERGERPPKAAA